MPLTIPVGALTKANWVTLYLKPLLDSVETIAGNAATAAANAATLAGQKYTKPAGGITEADLSAALVARIVALEAAVDVVKSTTAPADTTAVWVDLS